MKRDNALSIRSRNLGRLKRPGVLVLSCAVGFGIALGGCKQHAQPSAGGAQGTAIAQQQIQSQTMAFATRYIAAMADVYNRAQQDAKTTDIELAAGRSKVVAGTGAIGHAVETNPLVGLMNMAVMVTVNREIAERPWASEDFGAKDAAAIVAALKLQENDVWAIAGQYLTPAQIEELHQLCAQWLQEHPAQRYAISIRLQDFPQAKHANDPGQQFVSSVFGVVTLNPFTGLDPAVQEVERSRILAERMFFYLRHMPVLISWQADLLYLQMLDQPQIRKALADTTTVAGSTTRFTESTNKFADVSGKFADTIEKFRIQLPEQQSTLVTQLNDLVATQRSAALNQATTQVSVQSDALIKQLNTSISAQQDAMTKNLQVVTDSSIDRLYQRARSLVLIAVVSILAAFMIYRFTASRRRSA